MNITFEENRLNAKGVVYEDEVIAVRDFLATLAPEALEVDVTKCNDMHFAVAQQIVAYQKLYPTTFSFGEHPTMFKHLFEGLVVHADHCR